MKHNISAVFLPWDSKMPKVHNHSCCLSAGWPDLWQAYSYIRNVHSLTSSQEDSCWLLTEPEWSDEYQPTINSPQLLQLILSSSYCLKGVCVKSYRHTKKLATKQTWVALIKNQSIKVLSELAPTVTKM